MGAHAPCYAPRLRHPCRTRTTGSWSPSAPGFAPAIRSCPCGAAPTTRTRRAAPAPPTSTCCTRQAWQALGCSRPAQLVGALQQAGCPGMPWGGCPTQLLRPFCPHPGVAPQYVKVGIADPTINWIDLGASRRSAKTAIGFTGYPVRHAGRRVQALGREGRWPGLQLPVSWSCAGGQPGSASQRRPAYHRSSRPARAPSAAFTSGARTACRRRCTPR